MTSDYKLVARDIACQRGGRMVYEKLCLEVAAGQALILTGANGAGKSSLLRQIAGLLEFEVGLLELEAGDPDKSIAEQSHYVGHLDALKPSMSVQETLQFWARYLGGKGDDATLSHALESFALASLAEMPVAYLSAGQRRRLSLARLLVVSRPLWLLDEPTVALDAASVARLQGVMIHHLSTGGLIIAATHLDLGLPDAKELRLGAGGGR